MSFRRIRLTIIITMLATPCVGHAQEPPTAIGNWDVDVTGTFSKQSISSGDRESSEEKSSFRLAIRYGILNNYLSAGGYFGSEASSVSNGTSYGMTLSTSGTGIFTAAGYGIISASDDSTGRRSSGTSTFVDFGFRSQPFLWGVSSHFLIEYRKTDVAREGTSTSVGYTSISPLFGLGLNI